MITVRAFLAGLCLLAATRASIAQEPAAQPDIAALLEKAANADAKIHRAALNELRSRADAAKLLAGQSAHNLKKLLTPLAGNDAIARNDACELLRQLGAAAKPLAADLAGIAADAGAELEVRKAALRVIQATGPAAADAATPLLKLAQSNEAAIFNETIDALGAVHPDAAQIVPFLASQLPPNRKTGGWSKWSVAKALGAYGDEAVPAVRAFITAMNDHHDENAATDALMCMGNSALPILRDLLKGALIPGKLTEGHADYMCVIVLKRIEPPTPEALSLLMEILHDKSKADIHYRAVEALGHFGEAAIPELIVAAYISRDCNDRGEALRLLQKLKAPPALVAPVLVHLLDDDSPYCVLRAVEYLIDFGPAAKQAVPALIAHLDNLKWEVRTALLKDRFMHSEEEIRDIKSGEKYDARLQAVRAIASTGANDDDTVRALARRLQNEESGVRLAALQALGSCGERARSTAGDVVKVVNEPDEAVQIAACNTLLAIGADPAGAAPSMVDLVKNEKAAGRARLAAAMLLTEWKVSSADATAALDAFWNKFADLKPNATDIAGGNPYRARTLGNRGLYTLRYGGSVKTEAAVEAALAFLVRTQKEDGHWDTMQYGAGNAVDAAVTGMALLAFLGAGHGEKSSLYGPTVQRAVKWIVARQKDNGLIQNDSDAGAHRGGGYPHAICTWALAEAAGIGKVPETVAAAQKAIDYATNLHQNAVNNQKLGWRYTANMNGDISVTAWFAQALAAGRRAGLKVDQASLDGAQKFLDSAEIKSPDGSHYRYMPKPDQITPRRAALGVASRLALGATPQELSKTVALFVSERGVPSYGANGEEVDLDYWLFGTLAAFETGGDLWRRWNAGLCEALTRSQNMQPRESDCGSWPVVGEFSSEWGRIGQTALGALCLEIYYRYPRADSAKNAAPAGR